MSHGESTDRRTFQIRRNLESRDAWDTYADHRRRVTSLLTSAARSPQARICILGAGNCNDVDLRVIRDRFARVHLVDLDGEALSYGVRRQLGQHDDRIELSAGVDLLTITSAQLTAALASLTSTAVSDFDPNEPSLSFDVVASLGVLSQLIEVDALGQPNVSEASARAVEVRNRHLGLMADLLAPDGIGILVTDFVSSQTCPELATTDDAALSNAARRWIDQGNFFTGLNPWRLRQLMVEESWPEINPTDVLLLRPWKWCVGGKIFAVTAVCFRRRPLGRPS